MPEPPQIPSEMPMLDKIEHFGAYLILAALLTFYLKRSHLGRKKALVVSVLLMLVVGALIEVLQGYTGRNPEASDLLADFIGAVCGGLLSLFLLR